MNFFKKIFSTPDEPIKTYEDFWNWFQIHENTFFKIVKQGSRIEKEFFSRIGPKLDELNEGFFYLTGMCDDHTAELIITADGNVPLIVFVEELVRTAPELKNWRFTALKPERSIEDSGITYSGHPINTENLYFYANEQPDYPDEIDLTFVHENINEENKSILSNGVYIFLDIFLGELRLASSIDQLRIIGKEDAEGELIPIAKLKDYLNWREKEFVEKYEGVRHDIEHDEYLTLQATTQNDNPMLAVINKDLLYWDSKASHPWMMKIKIPYAGENNEGMPNPESYQLMNIIEEDIMDQLKDADGYLNVGRETGNNSRKIYFACKDFRKPSKVLYDIQQQYRRQMPIEYDIFKDKYWQSMNHFLPNH